MVGDKLAKAPFYPPYYLTKLQDKWPKPPHLATDALANQLLVLKPTWLVFF